MTLSYRAADYFDVIIVGAGPSGSSCSMHLSRKGLKVLLLDKEHFPRDKVCGDGVSSKSVSMLRELGLIEDIESLPHMKIPGLELTSPDGTCVDIPLREKHGIHEYGYCIRRRVFDDAVFQCAKKHATRTIEGFTVKELKKESADGTDRVIGVKGGSVEGVLEFRSSVVVGADGYNGVISRELGVRQADPAHLFVSVRGYFRGVKDLKPRIEIHFLEETVPGYFWIFPVEKDVTNVGVAMTVEDVRKRRINPRNQLLDILNKNPSMASRFSGSTLIDGSLKAGMIPCGSGRVKSYGDGWLLIGDAASLADPLTGEGIGNALYSGKLAAETILEARDRKDYSSHQLSSYERSLRDTFDSQLRNSCMIQSRAKSIGFVNLVMHKAAGSRGLRELMADWLNNPVERKSYISNLSLFRILLTPPYW